jgi:hypothetical protein
MDDFCGKRAQHIGVAKVRHKPHKMIWIGAPIIGNRLRVPFFSRWFIIIGGMTRKSLKHYINGHFIPYICMEMQKAQISANDYCYAKSVA